MRVQIDVGRTRLTYDAPNDVRVGDTVALPPPPYDISAISMNEDYYGTVVELNSTYDGAVRSIRRVLTVDQVQTRMENAERWRAEEVERKERNRCVAATTATAPVFNPPPKGRRCAMQGYHWVASGDTSAGLLCEAHHKARERKGAFQRATFDVHWLELGKWEIVQVIGAQ